MRKLLILLMLAGCQFSAPKEKINPKIDLPITIEKPKTEGLTSDKVGDNTITTAPVKPTPSRIELPDDIKNDPIIRVQFVNDPLTKDQECQTPPTHYVILVIGGLSLVLLVQQILDRIYYGKNRNKGSEV